MIKLWCLILVYAVLCHCEETVFDVKQSKTISEPCIGGDGSCVHDDDKPVSMGQLRDLLGMWTPPPLNALLVGVVCVALYLAAKMRDHSSLPWRLYQYRSKVFIVKQDGGGDVELLRMRLDEIERERDDLKAVIENKRLTEKHSEVDLAIGEDAKKWEETVNSLQRKPPSSTRSECKGIGSTVCSLRSESAGHGTVTASLRRPGGRILKAPSLPSKDHVCSHIPMPSKPSQVFSSADYARKCREMLCKLNESEKKAVELAQQVASTTKLREDFELLVEQRNAMGRKISALTREKKEMAKQVITLQLDIKTVREQFDDVRRQHTALTRQFDQLNTNAKMMAKDKRTLSRQLGEVKEELALARTKLDGIHREKSRLMETIERMDSTTKKQQVAQRSIQTQAPKSSADVVAAPKASGTATTQRTPLKNKSKQKTNVGEQNDGTKAPSAVKIPKQKPVPEVVAAEKVDKSTSMKSSADVTHKLAKTLEDKCQEFVKQPSFVYKVDTEAGQIVEQPNFECKADTEARQSSPPTTSITPTKAEEDENKNVDPIVPDNKDVATLPPAKTTTTTPSEGNDKKAAAGMARKPSSKLHAASSKSKKVKSKDLTTKSSIDITEFARSLQKLERNVEINMKVREATDAIVYPTTTKQDNNNHHNAVTELYHNDLRNWESSQLQVVSSRDIPSSAVSDTDVSGTSICREEFTNESDLDIVFGNSSAQDVIRCSSCSICCLESQCSVCSAPSCTLDHTLCCDSRCLATCSSCSLPLEFSQSIESCDDDDGDNRSNPGPLDNDSSTRQGLAAIFGNGPVGEGGPWNLPGLSGIMTRTTRPTGSVLACQGSLGEVGDVTSSNELVDLDVEGAKRDGQEEAPPHKKRVSCFTAANEDTSKRAVTTSPAFLQFLQELTTLVDVTNSVGGDAAASTQVFHMDVGQSQQEDDGLVAANDSLDTFEDSEDILDMCFSQKSTEYFINNDSDPIF